MLIFSGYIGYIGYGQNQVDVIPQYPSNELVNIIIPENENNNYIQQEDNILQTTYNYIADTFDNIINNVGKLLLSVLK